MEISSHHQEEGDMPIPINSAYGDGHHLIHHHHDSADHQPHNHIINNPSSTPQPQTIIPSNNGSSMPATITTTTTTLQQDHHDHDQDHGHGHVMPLAGTFNHKKSSAAAGVVIRYRECLKNHAASMGANATDGCGEFMPSGEEGSIEALKCSACGCHRNFHRKEVEGDHEYPHYHPHYNHHHMRNKKFLLGHHQLGYSPTAIPSRTAVGPVVPHHHMIMPYSNNNMGSHLPSESDEQDQDHVGGFGGGGGAAVTVVRPQQTMKKRFRTKFTQEQKEKMLGFAEKVGWKIQKQEESVVQQFCQEIGVKRRVLKVWMHNNKHNLAKKTHNNNNNINLPPA